MRRLIFVFIGVFFLIGTFQADAHGYVVRAIPEDRAVFDRAPSRVQYWFSEALEPAFSELNVRDQEGEIVASGGVPENNNALLTAQLPSDLPDGAYIVELRPAFASDGHVVAESRVFFVGEAFGGIAGLEADDTAEPIEVIWRTLLQISNITLFGLMALYVLVLLPAWGNPKYDAGMLPPRVIKRMNVIAGYALLVIFFANGLALIQQTMVFFNIDFRQALDPSFWSLVRVGSRFGDIWNVRIFLLGLVGIGYLANLYFQQRQPEIVGLFWTGAGWIMALVLGTSSVLSHGAGSLVVPALAIAITWLHAIAVGVWAGGLVALVLLLPVALKPYEGERRRRALLVALRRFSYYAAVSLLIVIFTGLYNATNYFFTPSDVDTTFGGALLLKLILVAPLVGLGALHHIALRPERYTRFRAFSRRFDGFTRSLRLESVLVIAVLGSVGLLAATPLPVPEFIEGAPEPPTEAQQFDDYTVVLTILPGGPGVNTYDATITQDGERAEDLTISVRQLRPSRDFRGDWLPVEASDKGVYVAAGDEIDEAGLWWTVMDITLPDGEGMRLGFDWQISEDAAVLQELPLNAGNVAALGGVLVALGIALFPSARRFVKMLNLDTASVTLAAGSTVIVMAALVVAYVIVDNSRQDYDATINPAPEFVNAVLPTQASLDRGADLFDEACAWDTEARDFAVLRERLPRLRDEELYMALIDGWRDLPACDAALSRFQRWDVVNYLRTFEVKGLDA